MPSEAENEKPRRRRSVKHYFRSLLTAIMTEGMDPWRASAALFIGIFIGVVPIYGFQSLAAIGLATILKLNKPLTFGATFINNPLLQPFLVFSSVELGNYILKGDFVRLPATGITGLNLGDQLSAFAVGSIVLGVLLGGMAACVAFLVIFFRSPEYVDSRRRLREGIRFVNSLFEESPYYARRFVTWKMRLDKIFSILLSEDLGQGRAVDLGCGYGMALSLVEYRAPGRHLIGCDLDKERVRIAGKALSHLNAEILVCDVRDFVLPEAGLIMIVDVLQYLDQAEQRDLLSRCCSALVPGGKLVFRVHDRERGLVSKLTKALDKIIFRLSRGAKRPTTLPADEYIRVVGNTGMIVTKQHFINRLPLAHILVTAEKPGEDPASGSRAGSDARSRVGQ